MPKNRLRVGMDGAALAQSREKVFGSAACHLEPKSVGTEVQLAGPSQRSPTLTKRGLAKECIIHKGGENAPAGLLRKVHCSFHTVAEGKRNSILFKDFDRD
jgi:hypothetical protein